MRKSGGLLSLINDFVDRAIGADGLRPSLREKLLRRQFDSVAEMAPAMLASSIVVVSVLLYMTWGQAGFLPVSVLGSALVALHGIASLVSRLKPGQKGNVDHVAAGIVTMALVLGILWGVLLSALPIAEDSMLRSAVLIGGGGILCVSVMALVNYPQAMAAYSIPLIIGALIGLTDLGAGPDLWVYTALLTGFTLIMVIVTTHHASGFVALRASEKQVQEHGEIIGLLLREFEQAKSDWIWGTDPAGLINRLSVGFTTATGVSEADLIGGDFLYFLSCITEPDDPLVLQLDSDIEAHEIFQDVELQVIAGGQECWWSLTGRPAYDEAGLYLGYIGTGSDITQRKLADRRITTLAHHDGLTGLLNRGRFTDHLNQSVSRLERYGSPFAVMLLDLDRFKAVNDSQGHRAGDQVLVEVARRIVGQLRESDIAARLGGDEFAILLPGDCSEESVRALAARLVADIKLPVLMGSKDVSVGVSIGVAIAPAAGSEADQILHNTDLALYRAKTDGRGDFRLFESSMDSEERQRRVLESELRNALVRGELVLHYQPLVSAVTSEAMGFEALIRWNHPERGLVSPCDFIGLAEESDLIIEIGDWTIDQACKTAALWPEHLTVSVNLSAKHFRRSDIGHVIRDALERSGLAPHRLEVEITEGLLLESLDAVVEKLKEIRALGVTIAMDDFGTGYSSLSYLLKFPFDKIKIDQSFVAASVTDEVARDILKAIAAMGRSLKVTITAEGVETAEQAAFLSEIACHQLQGYHFARPLDPIELPNYLLSHVAARIAERDATRQVQSSSR